MAFIDGYVIAMKSVNIAELKNRLSHYLRQVRRGEPVLIRDRDRIIARIEPVGSAKAGDAASRLADLEAKGIVRRGKGGISKELFRNRPKTSADVVAALLRDREDGL